MREEKYRLEPASEELDRRSRYLSSLVRRTRLAEEEEEAEKKDQAKPREEEGAETATEKCAGERDEPQVRLRAADMPAAMQGHAFRRAREALAAMPKLDSKHLALALKKEFDLSYGLAWHCIVGTSFGSYVTHSVGGFVYFSIDKAYGALLVSLVTSQTARKHDDTTFICIAWHLWKERNGKTFESGNLSLNAGIISIREDGLAARKY